MVQSRESVLERCLRHDEQVSLVCYARYNITDSSAICIIFRKNWGYLFNNDPEVVALVATVMPYIALFQITDGVTASTGAILRSLGLHTTGALINLMSYYVIGLPFGLWLTFTPKLHLGLVGLWIGLSAALGYGSIVSSWLVWNADWKRAVERVRENLGLNVHGEIGADGKWTENEEEDGRGQATASGSSQNERTPLLANSSSGSGSRDA